MRFGITTGRKIVPLLLPTSYDVNAKDLPLKALSGSEGALIKEEIIPFVAIRGSCSR